MSLGAARMTVLPIVMDYLQRYPAMRERLATIFRSLDEASLRRLNARIAVDGERPRDVARDYLGSSLQRR